MKQRPPNTPESRQIAKLERAVIRTALARYEERLEVFGPPTTRGDRSKKSFAHLVAAQKLYEAINGK